LGGQNFLQLVTEKIIERLVTISSSLVYQSLSQILFSFKLFCCFLLEIKGLSSSFDEVKFASVVIRNAGDIISI